MPVEPSAAWWPIGVLAVGIVSIGAVMFAKWLAERGERNSATLGGHDTKLEVHEVKIEALEEEVETLEEDVDDLKHGEHNG